MQPVGTKRRSGREGSPRQTGNPIMTAAVRLIGRPISVYVIAM